MHDAWGVKPPTLRRRRGVNHPQAMTTATWGANPPRAFGNALPVYGKGATCTFGWPPLRNKVRWRGGADDAFEGMIWIPYPTRPPMGDREWMCGACVCFAMHARTRATCGVCGCPNNSIAFLHALCLKGCLGNAATLHHQAHCTTALWEQIYCNQPGATWRRSYQAGCSEGATSHRPRRAPVDALGNLSDGARMCHPPTAVHLVALANTAPCLLLWRNASFYESGASP